MDRTLAIELGDIIFNEVKKIIDSTAAMSRKIIGSMYHSGGPGSESEGLLEAINKFGYVASIYFPYIAFALPHIASKEWWAAEGSRLVNAPIEEFVRFISGVHIIVTDPFYKGPKTGTGKTTSVLWLACRPMVNAGYTYKECVEDVFSAGLYANNVDDAKDLVKEIAQLPAPIPFAIFDDFGGYGGTITKDKEFIGLFKRLLTLHRSLVGVILIAATTYRTVTGPVLVEATSLGLVQPHISREIISEVVEREVGAGSGNDKKSRFLTRIRWVQPDFSHSTVKFTPFMNPLLTKGRGTALITYIPHEDAEEIRSSFSYKLTYSRRRRGLTPSEGEELGGEFEEE